MTTDADKGSILGAAREPSKAAFASLALPAQEGAGLQSDLLINYDDSHHSEVQPCNKEQGGGQGHLQGPGTFPLGHECVEKVGADRDRVTKS